MRIRFTPNKGYILFTRGRRIARMLSRCPVGRRVLADVHVECHQPVADGDEPPSPHPRHPQPKLIGTLWRHRAERDQVGVKVLLFRLVCIIVIITTTQSYDIVRYSTIAWNFLGRWRINLNFNLLHSGHLSGGVVGVKIFSVSCNFSKSKHHTRFVSQSMQWVLVGHTVCPTYMYFTMWYSVARTIICTVAVAVLLLIGMYSTSSVVITQWKLSPHGSLLN